ncbi:hypothetical protein GCM10022221_45250 [Actinocorallia aurea]
MKNRFERRCNLLLRSYPPRYREVRRDEIVATLLDAAEPGASVPSPRESWDVVRGGWATRLRDRPPLWRWLAYRLLDIRVPYRHRMWVRDDALGRFHFLRTNVGHLVFMSIIMVVVSAGMGLYYGTAVLSIAETTAEGWLMTAGVVAFTLLNPLFHRGFRRRILLKHEFDEDGTPLGPPLPPEPLYTTEPAPETDPTSR